jgi:hypothetical protein
MRRSLTLCRHGLSVAAAVVVLTACGGSGDGNSSASSSSSAARSSSTAPASADPASSEFCSKAAAVQSQVGPTLNQSDPATIPQALRQAATAIRAITPPPEIASDWNALAGGVDQIAAAFGSVNPNDPQAMATLQQQLGQLTSQLSGASNNVQKYLADKCGLGTAPTGSAAPSS